MKVHFLGFAERKKTNKNYFTMLDPGIITVQQKMTFFIIVVQYNTATNPGDNPIKNCPEKWKLRNFPQVFTIKIVNNIQILFVVSNIHEFWT
jgi:hypothetical protein